MKISPKKNGLYNGGDPSVKFAVHVFYDIIVTSLTSTCSTVPHGKRIHSQHALPILLMAEISI